MLNKMRHATRHVFLDNRHSSAQRIIRLPIDWPCFSPWKVMVPLRVAADHHAGTITGHFDKTAACGSRVAHQLLDEGTRALDAVSAWAADAHSLLLYRFHWPGWFQRFVILHGEWCCRLRLVTLPPWLSGPHKRDQGPEFWSLHRRDVNANWRALVNAQFRGCRSHHGTGR